MGNDWCEITTPFLDRHNDSLQIYVKPEKNSFLLTDDGYVIDDLKMSGCDLDSPKRQSVLKEVLNGFDVSLVENRLETKGSKKDFPQLKHDLIQAMLSVNDMFYLSSPSSSSLFFEDMIDWLDSSGIRCTRNVLFKGKSGFAYSIFGVIPKSSSAPERIVQPINQPDKNSVQQLIFEWDDTRETRPDNSILYPVLNDTDREIQSHIVSAFEAYNISCILWSQRNKYKELLVA